MAVEFRIDRFAASGSAPGYVLGGLVCGDDDRSRSVPTLFRKGLLFVLCVDLMEILGFVGS